MGQRQLDRCSPSNAPHWGHLHFVRWNSIKELLQIGWSLCPPTFNGVERPYSRLPCWAMTFGDIAFTPGHTIECLSLA